MIDKSEVAVEVEVEDNMLQTVVDVDGYSHLMTIKV